jgi:hypothetical protein
MEEFGKMLLGGGMTAASAINPAMAIAGAAQPLFQGILGLTQGARARKMSQRYPRPSYQIPGAATNAINDQRNLAMGQAPGLDIARQQLMQSQAGSANAIMGSGGGGNETLAALAMLDQNAGDQALNLGAMQEQFKAQQMGNLINQQNAYADWQAKKQEWDSLQPYIQAQEKAAAMNDAANVNIDESLRTGGGLVAQTLRKNPPALGAAAKTGLVSGDLGRGLATGILSRAAKAGTPTPLNQRSAGPLATSDVTKLPRRLSPVAQVPATPDDGTQPTDDTPLGGTRYNAAGEPIVGEIFEYNIGNRTRGRKSDRFRDLIKGGNY